MGVFRRVLLVLVCRNSFRRLRVFLNFLKLRRLISVVLPTVVLRVPQKLVPRKGNRRPFSPPLKSRNRLWTFLMIKSGGGGGVVQTRLIVLVKFILIGRRLTLKIMMILSLLTLSRRSRFKNLTLFRLLMIIILTKLLVLKRRRRLILMIHFRLLVFFILSVMILILRLLRRVKNFFRVQVILTMVSRRRLKRVVITPVKSQRLQLLGCRKFLLDVRLPFALKF